MPRKPSTTSSLASAIAAAIRAIPRGKVATYGTVAAAAGFPRCARQVSRVLQSFPDLPWQRVLGAGGRILLTGEYALEQRFLLETEGVRFRGRRVDLAAFGHGFSSSRRRGRTLSLPIRSVPGVEARRRR